MKYLTEDQKDILRQACIIVEDLSDELIQKDSEVEFYVKGMSGYLASYEIREAALTLGKLTGDLKRCKTADNTNMKIINRLRELQSQLN